MLAGFFPWQDATNPLYLKDLILNREINFDSIKNTEAQDLLKRILNKNPENRASLEEILESPWVTQNGKV